MSEESINKDTKDESPKQETPPTGIKLNKEDMITNSLYWDIALWAIWVLVWIIFIPLSANFAPSAPILCLFLAIFIPLKSGKKHFLYGVLRMFGILLALALLGFGACVAVFSILNH